MKAKAAPVVAMLNMKGGVGKTTISAHVFREFYLTQMRNVLLIDLDPQFNLTQTLLKEDIYEKIKADGKTILSVLEDPAKSSLYTTASSKSEAPDPSTVVVNMKRAAHAGKIAKLDLLAGDFSLVKFSLINEKAVQQDAKRRFKEFIEKAKNSYDLVCIDCNPSSSFLTLCALGVASHLLVPVRPDRYSMLGLRLLDEFVKGLEDIPQKPKKIIVLNGVATTGYDPAVENELRSDPVYGKLTLSAYLTETRLLQARPSYTGFATDRRVAHSTTLKTRIRNLSSELSSALGFK